MIVWQGTATIAAQSIAPTIGHLHKAEGTSDFIA